MARVYTSKISLIATVFNDMEGTRKFLRRMEEQTRGPDEIVIADAGSKDGTWEQLVDYAGKGAIPLVAIQEMHCNPARGRNLAAIRAKHGILTVTDIGCDWEPEWFEELVAPFEQDPRLEAVMGSWKVRWEDQKTCWSQCDPLLRGNLEFRATTKSHSANRAIAYAKSFYLSLGGLPEDLRFAGDDLALDYLIQAHGRRLAAAPVPRCVWERPQTLSALRKESRRNFKGAAESGVLLRYFCLVGGRILVEWLVFGALLLAVILGIPWRWTGASGALAALLLIWRIRGWINHLDVVRRRGGQVRLWHVAVLDYITRIWSLVGYLEGFCYGARHCSQCRRKLRAAGIGWW